MEKKKKIAIALGVIWALLLIYRIFFSEEKKVLQAIPEPGKQITSPVFEQKVAERAGKYPGLVGYSFKRDIFADLISKPKEEPKGEKAKKPEAQPAPPLPILPEQPKIVKEEKQEEKVDPLKDIILLGILDKKEKRFAFIKKGNDIKSFKRSDKVYDTEFIIERIGRNEIALINSKGETKILKLDKEATNDKKD